jgi:hypothetical protein
MSSKIPSWSIESNDHFDMDYRRNRSNYLADEDLRPKREYTEQHQHFCRDECRDACRHMQALGHQSVTGEETRHRNAVFNRCQNKSGPPDEQARHKKHRTRADQTKINQTDWSEDNKGVLNHDHEAISGRGKKNVTNKVVKTTEPHRRTDPEDRGTPKIKQTSSSANLNGGLYAGHQEEKSTAVFTSDVDMRCTTALARSVSGSVAVSDHDRGGSVSAGALARADVVNVSKRVADDDSRRQSLKFDANNSKMCNKEERSVRNVAKVAVQGRPLA